MLACEVTLSPGSRQIKNSKIHFVRQQSGQINPVPSVFKIPLKPVDVFEVENKSVVIEEHFLRYIVIIVAYARITMQL